MTAPALPDLIDCPLLADGPDRPTDYWNDSCAIDELEYAIARGATGATSNPSIVLEVLRKERDALAAADRRARGRRTRPGPRSRSPGRWSRRWPSRGAGVLEPVFGREGGRKGRLSIQTEPANHRNADADARAGPATSRRSRRTCRSSSRPRARASRRSRRATAAGVSINATGLLHGRRRRSRWPRPSSADWTALAAGGGDPAP